MPKIREPGTRQSNTAKPESSGPGSALTQFKPGQSGNPLGRTPGSRDRINRVFLTDLQELWEERGPKILELVAASKPEVILGAMVSLVPKEVKIDAEQRVYVARAEPLSSADWTAKHAADHALVNGDARPSSH